MFSAERLESASMDFSFSPEELDFRDELRGWLDSNLPPFLEAWRQEDEGSSGMLGSMNRRKAWQRKLNEGRWAAVTWPEEWGGREATAAQSMIYSEEMAGARTPAVFNSNGLWQIGPMIIRWGTEEQKQKWVPNILNADDHWCQGFSEPEAGSDLANLRTMAIRDGDHYVLNGQKTWTSSAQHAKWGLFLVRTDPEAIADGRKHEGITALIVDLEIDGIEIQPIRDITGEETFCEVTFNDARVPAEYRLGEDGEGWLVAMGTLGKERVGTAGMAIGMKHDLDAMIALARSVNPTALDDTLIRARVADVHTRIEYTRLLNLRALSLILKDQKPWPEVPLAKLQWSHLSQTLADLAMDLLGPDALYAKPSEFAVENGAWNRLYVFQRYTSIGAGTSEIQKNILADRAIKMSR